MICSLSSITNLSAISNRTATNSQIATEVSRYIHGALHCQQHISQWLPSIQANFPQSAAAISLLTRIKRVMDQALVSTYSVGCFQARVIMVDSGQSLVEYGSSNYAQLKWKDTNARGFSSGLSSRCFCYHGSWHTSITPPYQTTKILTPCFPVRPT